MKKILIITLLVLVAIQFIRIDKTNPPVDAEQDYVTMTHAPVEVKNILKRACYDCHSNEVKYPWYTNIAPVSWYIKEHINQGKEYLNFSEFGKYNKYQKEHVITGLFHVIEKRTMPLDSYVWLHEEAALSAEDNKILLEWFETFLPQDSVK
ncbi:MAG: heme-binding domain-containing protein [Flavobacteriaceae bacterium]|jgi:uncharacterized protein YxeA|nr:heme-binding domain-containing protein [Flavobacteriaceae bacterium]